MGLDYSVIICSHNPRRDYFDRTLVSLLEQTMARERWEVLDRQPIRVTDEYKMYSQGLSGRANLNFKRETARSFSGLEPLIKDQFLIVSEKYRH